MMLIPKRKDVREEKKYMKDYQALLDSYESEMIQTLRELVAIRSVVEPEMETPDAPFGEGVERAFRYMMDKSKAMGFKTMEAGHFGGHAEMGEGEECMGILVHLDTVPEGEGWTKDPFGGEIEDGKMYGRGTNDDKGPAVAALYAMKALRESGVSLKKRVRLIYGLDEEVGEWEGIVKYLAEAGSPDFGFTPDADFPLVHAEMGILVFDLVKKLRKPGTEGIVLKSINGGTAYNMVPNRCSAIISAGDYSEIKQKIDDFRERTGYAVSYKGRGKSLEIIAEGLSAHGAMPWKGVNAISIMFFLLSEVHFNDEDVNDFIRFYNEAIGFNLHGKKIGCGFQDEVSGELVWNTGIIQMDQEVGRFTINVRYPVTMEPEMIYEGMMSHLDEYGFGVVKSAHKAAIYVEKDDPLVTTLMDVYREHTGDMKAEPMVIGGGSYARAIDHAVAYGMKFPDQIPTEHQKDEHIDLALWMKAAKIYADAIYRLCGE